MITTEKQYAAALSEHDRCSMLASANAAAKAEAANAPVTILNGWSLDVLISISALPPNGLPEPSRHDDAQKNKMTGAAALAPGSG